MSRVSDLYHQLVRRDCRGERAPMPLTVLEDLVARTQMDLVLHNDAVCYVLCRDLWGGTIGQLTLDPADPGYVNRASGATEGFYPRDICRAAQRKGRGMATAVRTYEHKDFLARDTTGSLAQRAANFEEALIRVMEARLSE